MRRFGIGLALAATLAIALFLVHRISSPDLRPASGATAIPPATSDPIEVTSLGATQPVALTPLATSATAHVARLAGTVFMPPSWQMHVNLTFFLLTPDDAIDPVEIPFSKLSPVSGTPGFFRFDAGEQPEGTWRVEAGDCGFEQVVETSPDGMPIAIVVGEPADVSIWLIDADSGLPVQRIERFLWHCRRPDAWQGGASQPIRWNASAGCYALRAPAGELEFELGFGCDSELILGRTSWREVHPGSNELTLLVERHCLLEITLKVDDESSLCISDSGIASALAGTLLLLADRDADAQCTKLMTMSDLAVGIVFRVRDPGRYRVHLEEFPGFAPVAPVEVEVCRDRKCESTVVLQRVR